MPDRDSHWSTRTYAHTVTLQMRFEDAVARTRELLAEHRFGVITETTVETIAPQTMVQLTRSAKTQEAADEVNSRLLTVTAGLESAA